MTIFKRAFIILSVCLGFVFSSCSDDDFEEREPDSLPRLKLSASSKEITLFEKMTLTLNINPHFVMSDVEVGYDSISWIANGVAFSPGFLSVGKFPNDPCKLEITECRPGNYKVYCLGYKDGEVAGIDSIEYVVKPPEGDFIKINWFQPPYGMHYCFATGMTPFNYLHRPGWRGMGGEELKLQHYWGEDGYQFALLTFIYWSVWESMPGISPQETPRPFAGNLTGEYKFLYNYLIEFYGEPLLQYSGNDITQTDLWDEYEKRFTYSEPFYPLVIWETPTTVICLTATDQEPENNEIRGFIKVIAQPRELSADF